MKELSLYKPNELISIISELELNRTARHLFNYFLRHAQKKIKFDDYQKTTFEINIHELNELAKINQKDYKIISKSLDALMKPVTLIDNPKRIVKMVPVTYVNVDREKGIYQFTLQEIVIDLLKNTDYFTKLDLKEFNPLKSKHSIVIFEYLKRYENFGQIPLITLEELRSITDTKDKYPNFTDFERYVLSPAKKEINEHTAFTFDYLTVKKRISRRPKVHAIQFHFAKKSEHSGIDLNVTEVTQKTCQNVAKNEDLHVKTNSMRRNAHAFDQLYLDFCKKFKDLSVKDYELALNTYELSTLHQFLNDMQKYSSLSSEKFLSYLEDRTSKGWQNYQIKKEKTSDEKIEDLMSMLRPRQSSEQ
jgi:plasmid replication initiation protein